ncbi:MAG: ABC transporter ATP-binding protein [Kiritimatiellales bacterium]|nr:ABC transporter ATP-binding protein [Kiritimatiellales bacterium]
MSIPIIQVKSLSIELSGNEILKDISMDIAAGEYVSIIGPNGAGKTTLIKCIAGIYSTWQGTLRIREKLLSEYKNKELARLMSYVPQAEGRTNPLTVEEFVATGRYPHLSAFTTMQPEDHRAVDAALERTDLVPFRQRTMNSLSGGERQMTFIAAALAQGASLLLLDEPSTFLDYRHQANVAAILTSACREHGITVLAVHHDVNTATACSDRIYGIKDGRMVCQGTPEDIAKADVLQNIYDTEFSITPSSDRTLPLVAAGGAL